MSEKKIKKEENQFSEELLDWFFSPLSDEEFEKKQKEIEQLRKNNLKQYYKKKKLRLKK
jgi:hypothetical protein